MDKDKYRVIELCYYACGGDPRTPLHGEEADSGLILGLIPGCFEADSTGWFRVGFRLGLGLITGCFVAQRGGARWGGNAATWWLATIGPQSGVACKYARQPGRHARAGQIRMAAEMPENPLHVEAQKREAEIPASPIRLLSRTDCMAD